MEMLPPAPVPSNVVVGATVVKRFPGYGERRGTIAEIDLDGGKVVVRKAIRDAGLEGRRKTNAVDATGALVPRKTHTCRPRDRSAVVAPDAALEPTATTSKFWGVSWDKSERRWKAGYTDANGKTRHIGYFDTQEQAAHAVNAAIRRAGLGGRRKTNPVVDGQLVPRARKAPGYGCDALRKRPRGVDPAAPPRRSARRSRQE